MGLFPKEIDFFEIFDRAALNLTKAGVLLVALMEKFDRLEERAKEIYEVEQEGDILTHEIMKKLNKTFITPIDREDRITSYNVCYTKLLRTLHQLPFFSALR